MKKTFFSMLCIAISCVICSCGSIDTSKSNGEEKTNTVTGVLRSIRDRYVENDFEDGPDMAEMTIRVDGSNKESSTYVIYYTINNGVGVPHDTHHAIGDAIEIEYEGELEELGEEFGEEHGKIMKEGDKWYRVNNPVYVRLIERGED